MSRYLANVFDRFTSTVVLNCEQAELLEIQPSSVSRVLRKNISAQSTVEKAIAKKRPFIGVSLPAERHFTIVRPTSTLLSAIE